MPTCVAGSFVALSGLTFDARPGEIYGLLGPNGAGKTTALRILSTILRPSGGSATVDGFNVLTQPARVRRADWLCVGQYGRLRSDDGRRDGGILRATARIDRTRIGASAWTACLPACKMNDIRDVLGAKMSTGMKQKVSIARALIHDPPVIIFDEATVGLDVLVARSLLDSIAELRDHGKCIVYSTHIMREVERLCDRIAIMHRGHILSEGRLEQLRERHGEEDLEELFFQLISRHDEQRRAS